MLFQTTDAFATRSLPRVLQALDAARFVVYGVVTEICVLCAVRGLLAAGKSVVIVKDAVKELRSEEAAKVFAEVQARGGAVATVSEIC